MSDDRLDEVPTAPVLPSDEPGAGAIDPAAIADEAVAAGNPDGANADASASADPALDMAASVDGPPARVREVIRGIHPELLCSCPECEPEFVELQWFSPEEQKKTKGQIMLFCGHSGRKYFSPAVELHLWVTEHAITAPKRGRAKTDG